MSKSILLVEDSPTQAIEYGRQLQHAGYEVHFCSDGFTALVMARHDTDAVVLDVNLPALNGFQVCRRLRRDSLTANIPIVMLTSISAASDTLHGLEAGANDYIPKDEFAVEQLLASLANLLSEHEQQV